MKSILIGAAAILALLSTPALAKTKIVVSMAHLDDNLLTKPATDAALRLADGALESSCRGVTVSLG